MTLAIRTITRVQDADDLNVSLGAGVDEYALCWDNDTAKFVLRQVAGVYLLATGATTGATAQAQTFTNGIVGPSWKPSSNSTTALQLQNATGTPVLNVDTTNSRVGIGTTAPGTSLELFDNNSSESGGFHIYHPNKQQGVGVVYDKIFKTGSNVFGHIYIDGKGTGHVLLSTIATGNVGIGTTTPATKLHSLLTSAATNAVTNVVTIGHDSSGTAAAGFGAGVVFNLQSSTTAAQSAARIQALWYEATHATRKADLVLTAFDTAEREGLRIRGAGSAPAIGFLGATPAARVAHVEDPSGGTTVDAEARSAINNILKTLENFGFHATS